jgi:uncharacterized membrane-anchored protein YjiN (DUF445 family)
MIGRKLCAGSFVEMPERREMRSVRGLGNVSLLVAVGGFAAVETALGLKWVNGQVWQVVGYAFEAATVGGLADWFAVTALFHEVPLPVIRRHTNIIVKNRARIVAGIAHMVQNRWLSPEVIREHVARFSASQLMLDRLSEESHAGGLLSFLRDLLGKVAGAIDEPEISAFLDRILRDQLADFEIAGPMGRWIGAAIRRGDQQAVWETVLSALEESTRGADLRDAVRSILDRVIREAGVLWKVGVGTVEMLRVLTVDEVVDKLLRGVEHLIHEARGNPQHPLRVRLDGLLLEFADGLAVGRPETIYSLEKLRRAFVEAADTREYIGKALTRLQETVTSELSKPGSDLDQLIRRIFREQLAAFRQDTGIQAKVDALVRKVATEFVEERHAQIGVMVRGSLEKLSNLDLVSQIEEQVGTDLQYIRLNGAIVGGLVGAILAIGKWLL